VHTFIAALWGVGIKARGFAFGLVGLTCILIVLWVGIGNGIHRNYEAPVPAVRYFNHYPFILFSSFTHAICTVLVLD
jgi:hypothetical protein